MSLLRALPRSGFERLPVMVGERTAASRIVAAEVASLIRERQRAGQRAVLGLATGSTPIEFYAELVRLHREESLGFGNVVTFNLDEYHPLPATHPRSFHQFMQRHLFEHIDLPPASIHQLDGSVPAHAVAAECERYEKQIEAAGGIDFQILGIGRSGHIGFNEPGSARDSRTRLVTLYPTTRQDAADAFGGEEQSPRFALTMGIGTVLRARRIVLMTWGGHKAAIVRAAIEEPANDRVPASWLQEHPAALVVLDPAAAADLSRFRELAP